MAKQTYIREEIRKGIYRNFKMTYRKMLIDNVYKNEEMVDKMLDDNKMLFDKIVEITFKDDPCETFLKEYEGKTGDNCLRNYIAIYKDLIDETSSAVYDDDGTLIEEWIEDYFSKDINSYVNKIYKSLETDCENNFFWWRKLNATALRRQLTSNVMFFSEKKMNALCRKYLNRDYDFSRMTEKKYNARLIVDLDRVMDANGNRKVYTYPTKDQEGNVVICEAEKRPNVPYYKVEYRARENEKFSDNLLTK